MYFYLILLYKNFMLYIFIFLFNFYSLFTYKCNNEHIIVMLNKLFLINMFYCDYINSNLNVEKLISLLCEVCYIILL